MQLSDSSLLQRLSKCKRLKKFEQLGSTAHSLPCPCPWLCIPVVCSAGGTCLSPSWDVSTISPSLCSALWELFALEDAVCGPRTFDPTEDTTLRARFPWVQRETEHKWPGFSVPAGPSSGDLPPMECRWEIQHTKPKFQKRPQALTNQMLFLFYLTMDLFQLYRNMHVYDKNWKEIYASKNSSLIVLVLEGIKKIFEYCCLFKM